MQHKIDERRAQMDKAMKGGASAGSMTAGKGFLERLDDEIDEARRAEEVRRGELAKAEEAAREAQRELLDAEREKKALEKHRENWRSEIAKEAARKEELTLDEIGQSMHQRRGK